MYFEVGVRAVGLLRNRSVIPLPLSSRSLLMVCHGRKMTVMLACLQTALTKGAKSSRVGSAQLVPKVLQTWMGCTVRKSSVQNAGNGTKPTAKHSRETNIGQFDNVSSLGI